MTYFAWSVTQNLNLLNCLHVPAESKHSKLPAYYTSSNDPSHIICEYLPTLYDAEHSVKVAQRQIFESVSRSIKCPVVFDYSTSPFPEIDIIGVYEET